MLPTDSLCLEILSIIDNYTAQKGTFISIFYANSKVKIEVDGKDIKKYTRKFFSINKCEYKVLSLCQQLLNLLEDEKGTSIASFSLTFNTTTEIVGLTVDYSI